jgi:protease-4
MNEPRSFIARLFGWISGLLVFLYRTVMVVLVLGTLLVFWLGSKSSTPKIEDNMPLTLIPTGVLVDQVAQSGEGFLRQFSDAKPTQTSMRDLVDALDDGAKDTRVPFVVLKLDDMAGAGMAQLQDVAAAMKRFRAAGKPIYVYGESFDQSQYFLAAQADEISLDPMGLVLIQGFGSYNNYYKEALDKLGVQVNIFRVGEYKSAVEPYERDDMSQDAKTANQAWLGDLWKEYGVRVGEGRNQPADAINQYVAGLSAGLQKDKGDGAALALESKLVTRVETQAEFRKRMIAKVGENKDKSSFRQIGFDGYLKAVKHEAKHTPSTKIALVVVEGEIVDGESDTGTAGGDTIADLLDDARHDSNVEAVLFRVNSPGGSVLASEKIRRAVKALQEAGKPVVVSMSTLAASGGYWISMGADQIWAEPTTITGSIGIFGLIPTIDKPLEKLGIHTDGVGTTSLAGAFRIDRPLTPEVKVLMQSQIEKGYQNFIEGVAKGRDIPVEQVNSIARGRVWSGAAAKELGLVDSLGTMADAQAALAKLAKLEPDGYELKELEPNRDFVGQILGKFFGQGKIGFSALAQLMPTQGALAIPSQQFGNTLRRLDDPQHVYAYCFCDVAVSAPR